MKKYSFGITTFSKRLPFLETLVKQIRQHSDADILLAVNGDYKSKFNNEYRKNILTLCNEYDNIFPIFFPELRGVAKLWNTMIIQSATDCIIILNDDLEINSESFFSDISRFDFKSDPTFALINNSFSHFIINKKLADDIGYFDERFLGFGDEDGDIMWRHIKKYNAWVSSISIHGIVHHSSTVRDENVRPQNKWSMFNKEFLHQKYEACEHGLQGPMGWPMKKVLEDEKQYPYESFYLENKDKL